LGNLDAFLARMLDEQGQVEEDDIPYYAWLWPTAKAMAEYLLQGPNLDGVAALELGCGTGLVGLAAALRGAHVTLTDLQEGALKLAQLNAETLRVQDRVTVTSLDWRAPAPMTVGLLLGSDVLYESRFAEPVAAAICQLLHPQGVALIGDPSRPHMDAFIQAAQRRNLVVAMGPVLQADDGPPIRLLGVQHQGNPAIPHRGWTLCAVLDNDCPR
jgi:predicted nicotinamide N-methyase